MSGMKRCQLAAFVAVGFCAIGALAQGSEPYFIGLGDLPGGSFYSVATGVSATAVHEIEHIYTYIHLQGAGQTDTDGDLLADSRENIAPQFFIIGNRDTYNLANVFWAGYADYGDNEFISRSVEPTGAAAALLNLDWSVGGAQWRH